VQIKNPVSNNLNYHYDYGELIFFPISCKINIMTTINDLINEIYDDNFSHLEFEENMGGIDCDCHIHITLNTIAKYAGIEVG
jgi:hypothetical protein